MIAHGQMATLAKAEQPGNKGLSWDAIQVERGENGQVLIEAGSHGGKG